MRIGRMRNRVTLEGLTETVDPYGQRVQSWSSLGTYWAYLKALSGREELNASQITAAATHFVQMRYIGSLFPPRGIVQNMRLTLQTRVLNLLWVNNVEERRRVYELLAQELTKAPGPPGAEVPVR